MQNKTDRTGGASSSPGGNPLSAGGRSQLISSNNSASLSSLLSQLDLPGQLDSQLLSNGSASKGGLPLLLPQLPETPKDSSVNDDGDVGPDGQLAINLATSATSIIDVSSLTASLTCLIQQKPSSVITANGVSKNNKKQVKAHSPHKEQQVINILKELHCLLNFTAAFV